MQKRRRQSLYLIVLILALGLPGLVGIFVVQAQVSDAQPDLLDSIFQNGPTPSPTLTVTPLPSQTPAGSLLSNSLSPFGISTVDIFAFIQAPDGYVARPYVVLTAFGSIARSESVVIRGFIDSKEIICTESPCAVYLEEGGARIIFRAFTSTGESSEEIISSVSVTRETQGYWNLHQPQLLAWDQEAGGLHIPYNLLFHIKDVSKYQDFPSTMTTISPLGGRSV